MEKARFNNYVDTCLEAKEQGLDYTEIRKRLAEGGVEEEDIKKIIREADDRFLASLLKKNKAKKGRGLVIAGWAMLFIGGFITLGSFLQWFDTKGVLILSYGPILAGASLYLAGRAMGGKL